MMDLDDAWHWYVTTRKQLQLSGRLGRKHWDDLPWGGPLGRDDHFKQLGSDVVVADSKFCLEHLDDFAVLILFSVFESIVRDQVLSEVEDEKAEIRCQKEIRCQEGDKVSGTGDKVSGTD